MSLTADQIEALEDLAEHVDRRESRPRPVPAPGASTFAWGSSVAATSSLTERDLRTALNQLYVKHFVYRERKHSGGFRWRITQAGWDVLDSGVA